MIWKPTSRLHDFRELRWKLERQMGGCQASPLLQQQPPWGQGPAQGNFNCHWQTLEAQGIPPGLNTAGGPGFCEFHLQELHVLTASTGKKPPVSGTEKGKAARAFSSSSGLPSRVTVSPELTDQDCIRAWLTQRRANAHLWPPFAILWTCEVHNPRHRLSRRETPAAPTPNSAGLSIWGRTRRVSVSVISFPQSPAQWLHLNCPGP